MRKIAFVVQRYGLEVNGGSEAYCRQIAERLSEHYDVEVLTTKALDYVTWKNEYTCDEELINNVIVKRFDVDQSRDMAYFNKITPKVLHDSKFDYAFQNEWMEAQGPLSKRLLSYLENHKHDYKAIFFMTYLYYPTYCGIQIAPERAVLIPTAHDEPFIYLDMFKSTFHMPRAILYLTDEEKQFVHKLFQNEHIPSDVVGIGIDIIQGTDAEAFRDKYELEDPYILYVGRIEESKGCKELFDFFIQYKKNVQSNLKLILMGKEVMKVPKHKDIISLGFVSEEDKYNGMKGASFTVLPSPFESLSMSVLESMSQEVPVLVNGKCEVLKGHCEKSNGGLYYTNYEEFELCMDYLNDTNVREKMGMNARKYVNENYVWDVVIDKYKQVINIVNER